MADVGAAGCWQEAAAAGGVVIRGLAAREAHAAAVTVDCWQHCGVGALREDWGVVGADTEPRFLRCCCKTGARHVLRGEKENCVR